MTTELRDDRKATKRPDFADLAPEQWPTRCVVAEVKEDGIFVRVDIGMGVATVWNRHGVQVERTAVPTDMYCTLYGELLTSTQRSKSDDRRGCIVVFDCVSFQGVNLRTHEQQHRRGFAKRAIIGIDGFELVRQFSDWQEAWAFVVDNDLEGLVFKDPRGMWGDAWMRMKQVFEVDAEVLDVEPKALITDHGRIPIYGAVRAEVAANPSAFIGRVVKARGNAITDKGKLRHPRFGEWHMEKGRQS
jgi:hypothetical protein